MVEKHIHKILLSVVLQPILIANKAKPFTQLQYKSPDLGNQTVFKLQFFYRFCNA
jgi:hypothetical protein